MSTESIQVRLRVGDDVVRQAHVESKRQLDISRTLIGRPVEEALRLVPGLFALCGTAQHIAALSAVERGFCSHIDLDHRRARGLLASAEGLDSHARALLIEWPELANLPPCPEPYRELRKHFSSFEKLLYPHGDTFALCGGRLRPDLEEIEHHCDQVQRILRTEQLTPLGDDADALIEWAEKTDNPAARLCREVIESKWAGVGASDIEPLPALSLTWIEDQLGSRSDFGRAPTFEGTPKEPGPLSRRSSDPLVRSVVERWGRGLLARIAARLAELRAGPSELALRACSLRAADPGSPKDVREARGAGVAMTSRGPVAHYVVIRDGHVTDWRIAAPTEWAFHPEGAAVHGLIGMHAKCLPRVAQLHVAAMDPCVPWTVETEVL